MESTGEPNRVQISDSTREFLTLVGADEFVVKERGEVTVKGKGLMRTFWVKKKMRASSIPSF